jgi:tetratricopeptide (TPR) repeat protein
VVQAAEEMLAIGQHAVAVALYRRAAEAGDHRAVAKLINWPGIREDPAAKEVVYRPAIAAGDVRSLIYLATLRAQQGDIAEARVLYMKAIESGDVVALTNHAVFLRAHGELSQAIEHHRHQVEIGTTDALPILGALLLIAPHGQVEAEAVLRQGAAMLENRCRCLLAALLLQRGAIDGAAELIRHVRTTGDELVSSYAEQLAEEYELPP